MANQRCPLFVIRTWDIPNNKIPAKFYEHNFKLKTQKNLSKFSRPFQMTSIKFRTLLTVLLLITLNLQMVYSIPVSKTSNILQFELNYPVDLGKRCQSNEQCRVKDPNSGCYALKDFYDWRCMCTNGFVEKDGKCEANPEYLENRYERCASLDQVYVLALDRCVDRSQMPYYANRAGGGGGRGGSAGGGGRGGGLGGGGRGVGTRGRGSWIARNGGAAGFTGGTFGRRNSANFVQSNLLNISTLSLISCCLTYLLSTKHL